MHKKKTLKDGQKLVVCKTMKNWIVLVMENDDVVDDFTIHRHLKVEDGSMKTYLNEWYGDPNLEIRQVIGVTFSVHEKEAEK